MFGQTSLKKDSLKTKKVFIMVQNQNVKLSSKLIDFIFCVQTIYSLWIQLKFNPTRLQECLKNPYTHS
jgi:hypothetical protein